MNDQVVVVVRVKGGKPIWDDTSKKRLKKFAERMGDGKIRLIAEKWSPQRTLRQLRYYFGAYVRMLADVTGYTVDEAHWEIKRMCPIFHEEYFDIKTGEARIRYRSLTEPFFTIDKMGEVIDWLDRWFAENFPDVKIDMTW